MKCRKCDHYIPDGMIGCERCADASTRRYQWAPLGLVAQSRGMFTTRVISGVRHVEMFGGTERTFCGVPVQSHQRRGMQSFETLHDADKYVCEKCRAEITAILREADACSARS